MTPTICPGNTSNDPSHLINFVDKNCVPYTGFELVLFVSGCLLWVFAYGLLIRNSHRKKYIELPAIAICSDLAWEITWAAFYTTDMGLIPAIIYKIWLFLDLFIFWLLLRHGRKQTGNPVFKRIFTPLCFIAVPIFTVIYSSFVHGGYDTPVGATSAYMAQQFISVFCILLLLGSTTAENFSTHFAWLRSLGTALVAVFFFFHYTENYFLNTLGTLSIILDSIFLYLLWKARKAHKRGISPSTFLSQRVG
ncbi:hypothetical protein AB0K15_17695 [Amycolatopsis sp. NPDC049253]|uniref:transmembrane-type terpene cyclase n=1 Tax=Amycolatopsis sp. NPDC049253 TaxID=3155274 RepID=UPI0034429687